MLIFNQPGGICHQSEVAHIAFGNGRLLSGLGPRPAWAYLGSRFTSESC